MSLLHDPTSEEVSIPGQKFLSSSAITVSISVATDQAIFPRNSCLLLILFDDSAFRLLLSFLLAGWNRKLPLGHSYWY